MNDSVSINLAELRNRRKRIVDEIARLQKDADDLDNFIRNLQRFTTIEKPPDKKKGKGKKAKVPRPKGTPSTFEMVDMILASAEKEGRGALTSRELMDEIRAKYWPGVQNGQILPSIFGFKGKRLNREGDKWSRIKK